MRVISFLYCIVIKQKIHDFTMLSYPLHMYEKLPSRAKETTGENSYYHFKAVDRRFKTKAEMNLVSDITES